MRNFPPVAPFCVFFQELKDKLSDDQLNLIPEAIGNEGIRTLCDKLWYQAYQLESAEKKEPQLFFVNVDEAFIRLWRDYQKRWASTVGWISANMFLESQGWNEGGIESELRKQRPTMPTKLQEWHEFNAKAVSAIGCVGDALEFARDQVSQEDRQFREDFVDEIQAGASFWKELRETVGLDLVGIMRRRLLLPVVFLPKRIADSQSEKVKTALLANLFHAQRAFIHVGTDAALPLLRATMERVIIDHFPAFGGDVAKKIDSLKSRAALPVGCLSRKLHELRSAANVVLHGSENRRIKADSVEELANRELAAIEHFVQVRILIESVK